MLSKNRLYNLDYLRGLAAVGIMVFHYLTFFWGNLTSDSFISRFGFYGVSIFYILSGLTLFYVYNERMKPDKEDLLAFFKKRFFRIYPLLWIATLSTAFLASKFPGFIKLALNLTGLFGFVGWDVTVAVGIWSIGNELVFYSLFPLIIFLHRNSKTGFALLVLASFLVYVYFAFYILDPQQSVNILWRNYVNPLNQVSLFIGGFLLGKLFKNTAFNQLLSLLILVSGVCLILFYPTSGIRENLITGTNRLIFTASSFLICLGFYKTDFKFPKFIHRPLTLLGEASFSVYLLHPIVYLFLEKSPYFSIPVYLNLPPVARVIILIVITIGLSYFVYEMIEKYFIRLGATINLPLKAKETKNQNQAVEVI